MDIYRLLAVAGLDASTVEIDRFAAASGPAAVRIGRAASVAYLAAQAAQVGDRWRYFVLEQRSGAGWLQASSWLPTAPPARPVLLPPLVE